MFDLFLKYFVQVRYRTFEFLGHQVLTRTHYERTIEALKQSTHIGSPVGQLG